MGAASIRIHSPAAATQAGTAWASCAEYASRARGRSLHRLTNTPPATTRAAPTTFIIESEQQPGQAVLTLVPTLPHCLTQASRPRGWPTLRGPTPRPTWWVLPCWAGKCCVGLHQGRHGGCCFVGLANVAWAFTKADLVGAALLGWQTLHGPSPRPAWWVLPCWAGKCCVGLHQGRHGGCCFVGLANVAWAFTKADMVGAALLGCVHVHALALSRLPAGTCSCAC